jgi:hypothetical protein
MFLSASFALSAALGLVVIVLLSALMLMASVKWSEGYRYSFADALKLTLLTLVVTTVAQGGVSLALSAMLGPGIGAMLLSMFASLLVVVVISVWLYARRISSPAGGPIGLKTAIKITTVQSVILLGVALVLAMVLAFMARQGWITLPSPRDLGITAAAIKESAAHAA